MFSEKFDRELAAWKHGRSEWKSLIAEIRKDNTTREELERLRLDAGATPGEVSDLLHVKRAAEGHRAEAQKYKQAQKRLDSLDAEIEDLRRIAEDSPADSYSEAMGRLQSALDQRTRYYVSEYLGSKQAFDYLETIAKPMGLA